MDTGLRTALTLVKAAALGCLLALVVVLALRPTASAGGSPSATSTEDAYARVQARASLDQRCADADATRSAALIRTGAGRLRVVSFAAGWQVYNGRRPGVLLAVCPTADATTSPGQR